jgi:hypothetical protein
MGEKGFDDLAEIRPFLIGVFFPEVQKFARGAFPQDGTVVKLRNSLDPVVPGFSFLFDEKRSPFY